MLSNVNLDIDTSTVIVPNIINGFSMGFIFVPLSTIAMGTLRNEQIGSASGLYNLMRNIGGGVGISIVTTILSRRTQSHQAELVHHLTPYDDAFNRMLHNVQGALAPAMGTYASGQQAYATVYGMLCARLRYSRSSMYSDFSASFP